MAKQAERLFYLAATNGSPHSISGYGRGDPTTFSSFLSVVARFFTPPLLSFPSPSPPSSSSNFYLQTHLSLPSQDSGNPFPDLESARSLPCFTRKFLFSLPGKVQQKRCTRRGRRKGGVPPQCFSPFHLSAFGQNRQFFPFRQVKKFPYSCCTFSPGLWN